MVSIHQFEELQDFLLSVAGTYLTDELAEFCPIDGSTMIGIDSVEQDIRILLPVVDDCG